MSYVDPRARQIPGDDTSVPAPYFHESEDPNAAVRRPEAVSAYSGTEPMSEPAQRGEGSRGRRRAGRGRKPQGGGRAGRNLPAAIAVGLSLGLVVLASLLIQPMALL